MRPKLALVAVTAAMSLSLLGATSASAATEFGTNCTANRAEEGTSYSVVQLFQNGIFSGTPTSGVVTKWKIRLIPAPVTVPQQLKIFRPAAPGQFLVVGESAVQNVVSGENVFPTRIPIQAGDHLGLFGNSSINTLFCAENPETAGPGNSIGLFLGNPPVGSTAAVAATQPESLVPGTVVIEPDADNDGFGDETQDACPQSATTQAACPPVVLSTSTQVKKGSVTVIVTSSTAAPVTVKGVAKLGKGKKAKLNGGTQNLVPGTLAKFRLFFTKGLRNKLKELTPKQKLTLKVTVSGTSVSGAVTKKTLKLKLKGQAKP